MGGIPGQQRRHISINLAVIQGGWHTVVEERHHCTSYPPTLHSHSRYRRRVDYPKLEAALLKDVDDTYYYGANCQSCLHTSRLRLSKLREHLGGDFPVAKIRHRLKCDLCGSKAVTVTFLDPGQATGSLVHLFEKETRR